MNHNGIHNGIGNLNKEDLNMEDNNSVETIKDSKAATTSLDVAKKFGKSHDCVLRAIQDERDNLRKSGIPDFLDFLEIYICLLKGKKIKAIKINKLWRMYVLNYLDYFAGTTGPNQIHVQTESVLEFLNEFWTSTGPTEGSQRTAGVGPVTKK
jgi:hypothetical protein